MDTVTVGSSSWLGVLGTIGLALATYLTKRYVIPFLQVGKRKEYAGYIATIAADLIDELRLRYPERQWLQHLDEAIAGLAEICGVEKDIAVRAVRAAAARK